MRWKKDYQRIYNPNEVNTLNYFTNGEIGLITGEQRGDAFFKWHSTRLREWKANGSTGIKSSLFPPFVNISFSSQPGYSYQIKGTQFANSNSSNDKHKVKFELAYSITVHKAQGSGFDNVYLILPNPCGILSRELFPTSRNDHIAAPLAPTGIVGERGELEFVKNIKHLEGNLTLFHGITNMLRHGDFSFVDLQRLRITEIGELKATINFFPCCQ